MVLNFIALKIRFFLVVPLCYNDEQIYLRILIFLFYNDREIREKLITYENFQFYSKQIVLILLCLSDPAQGRRCSYFQVQALYLSLRVLILGIYRILLNTCTSQNRRAPPNFWITYLKSVAQRST